MLRYRFALAYQMSKLCPHRHGWLHACRYLQVRQDGLAELVDVGFLLDRWLNLWHINWVIFKPANTWEYTYCLFNLVAGTTSTLFDVRRRGTHTASLLPRGKRLYMRALEDVLWTEISMLLAVIAIHSHRLVASSGPCRTWCKMRSQNSQANTESIYECWPVCCKQSEQDNELALSASISSPFSSGWSCCLMRPIIISQFTSMSYFKPHRRTARSFSCYHRINWQIPSIQQ